jgi:hypothetical protein
VSGPVGVRLIRLPPRNASPPDAHLYCVSSLVLCVTIARALAHTCLHVLPHLLLPHTQLLSRQAAVPGSCFYVAQPSCCL